MAHSKIKRISVRQTEVAQPEWVDRWVDYAWVKKRAIQLGQDLVEWGWLASLFGSVLWVLLLFLGSDFSIAYEANAYLGHIGLYPPFTHLFAISLLLFLHGSISLLIRYATILPKIGRYGLVLTCIGLVFSAFTTSGLFAADARGVFQRFLDPSSEAQFGRLLNILDINSSYYAQLDWFLRTSLAFILISIGLMLFYVSVANACIVPKWLSAIMIFTAVSFQIPKMLVLDLRMLGPDLEYLFFGQNIFTVLLILLGANWLWTGVILLREQQKVQRLTLVMKG
jgi:hypothetical protein